MANAFVSKFGLPAVSDASGRSVPSGPAIVGPAPSGGRWDLIALSAYGDPLDYEPLVAASIATPIVPVFDGGEPVAAPLQPSVETSSDAGLPPWKRGNP